MNHPLILTQGGIGDCIQGFQCAHFAAQAKYAPTICCMVRDDVYLPLCRLFVYEGFRMFQHPQKEELANDYKLLKDPEQYLVNYRTLFDDIYFTTPDTLFNSPLAFDWQKFGVHPNTVRSTRLLTHRWQPQKRIYMGLTTSTPEYVYSNVPGLIREVAKSLPDYEIFFNHVRNWAGHRIDHGVFGDMPDNVNLQTDKSFADCLEILRTSAYAVVLDNGISHIAYQFGIPRLLIDNRLDINSVAWQARWRQDSNESIPYLPPESLAKIVKTNVEIPQTTLIPRNFLAKYNTDWKRQLIFKW
jgi:hypothetical protein